MKLFTEREYIDSKFIVKNYITEDIKDYSKIIVFILKHPEYIKLLFNFGTTYKNGVIYEDDKIHISFYLGKNSLMGNVDSLYCRALHLLAYILYYFPTRLFGNDQQLITVKQRALRYISMLPKDIFEEMTNVYNFVVDDIRSCINCLSKY